jgi:hypothetical protein
MMGKDRYLARGQTLKQLIATVWSQKNSALKIVFEAELREDKYDFIVAGDPQWWDSLQAEIDRRFQLVEQIENRDGTDVVVVKSVSLTEAESPKLSFGPVMERVVAMDQNWVGDAMLDLDTGKLIPTPASKDTASGIGYLLKGGVTVGFDPEKKETTLLGLGGTILVDTRLESWDIMPAADVDQRLKQEHGNPGLSMSGAGHGLPPMTLLFKTAGEHVGLLQITGFTENPRGVKIRYKLVQNSTSTNSQ